MKYIWIMLLCSFFNYSLCLANENQGDTMALTDRKCMPCEGGVPALNNDQEEGYLAELQGWTIDRSDIHKLKKEFVWKNFKEAMKFVSTVANLAEQEGHHPDIIIHYNHVFFEIFTHALKGLSENDFILASKIDKVASKSTK